MSPDPLSAYGQLFGLVAGTLLFGMAVYLIGRAGTAELRTRLETVPWEAGALPELHAWSRFHVRYYVYALLFLAFDMEMVFMYPWAVVFRTEGWMAMAEMGMFIMILLLGVLYAWREGAFEWS